MKLFFFYDENFRPLRDNLVSSLHDDFELREYYLPDLGVMKNRAGGGVPTYLYKAHRVRDAIDEVAEGEVLVFCDVDVQFFKPVKSTIEACMTDDLDILLQSEFEDIGVNIGFMAMRNVPSVRSFWEHVHKEIERLGGLDQRIVNNILYSGRALQDFGLRWDRFPVTLWASSLAASGRIPPDILLHHANFTAQRCVGGDPSVKLAQMQDMRRFLAEDPDGLSAFLSSVQHDPTILDYRDRHFGARRPGEVWATLPEGHLARQGGFSEKRNKKAGVSEASILTVSEDQVSLAGVVPPNELAAVA